MQHDMSRFRPVSIGIVAENKKRGTDIVHVWPVELVSNFSGEVNIDTLETSTNGIDNNGDFYKVEIGLGETIPAQWLGENNRRTSPDVRRGEQVIIYQSGDSAEGYYWDAMGRQKDLDLRRLETVVWAWSGDPKNRDTTFSRDNSYALEVSTHDKHITLTTSRANGEKASYTMQFNTGDGKFVLEDDIGNRFYLDSPEHHFRIENPDESFLEINKTVFNLFTKDEINLETNRYKLIAKDSITTETSTYTETSDTYTHNGKDYTVNSQGYTNSTEQYKRSATLSMIEGPEGHDAIVTFPSFACGPNASPMAAASGGFVGTIEGGLNQTTGQFKTTDLYANQGGFDNINTNTITWDSQTGPIA